ncbi:acyl-CoA N-acyltransferase [Phellopilus nigrolimitatus]|nr:acyl-CoA N-acyltransferase [Phellopilus nigrolimitatus]
MTLGLKGKYQAIKKANSASASELQCFVPSVQSIKNRSYRIHVCHASDLSEMLRGRIWAMFERNMKTIYEETNVFEWDPSGKQEEMFHSLARFLLVMSDKTSDDTGEIDKNELLGYATFRFIEKIGETWFISSENARRLGLGKAIIGNLEYMGQALKMTDIMLTTFTKNGEANAFYSSLGFEVDRTSPDYEEDEWVDEEEETNSDPVDYMYRRLTAILTRFYFEIKILNYIIVKTALNGRG